MGVAFFLGFVVGFFFFFFFFFFFCVPWVFSFLGFLGVWIDRVLILRALSIQGPALSPEAPFCIFVLEKTTQYRKVVSSAP